MSLSKFSDTLNLPYIVKGTSRIVSTHQTITGTLACYQLCTITNLTDRLKEPTRSKLIQWHGEHSNDEFIFDREINKYFVKVCLNEV